MWKERLFLAPPSELHESVNKLQRKERSSSSRMPDGSYRRRTVRLSFLVCIINIGIRDVSRIPRLTNVEQDRAQQIQKSKKSH